MQKCTVQHSCGHTAPHGLSGTEQDRTLRMAWLARQPCPDCWRAAQLAGATGQRDALSLPPLEGTDADIAWAEVIRAKAIEHNRAYHRTLVADDFFRNDLELKPVVLEAADAALRELEGETRANWWLEHRFACLNHVMERISTAIAPILAARSA